MENFLRFVVKDVYVFLVFYKEGMGVVKIRMNYRWEVLLKKKWGCMCRREC